MKEIRDILDAAKARPNVPFALATLVRAAGSSYRRPGARLLVGADGTTVGSLSAGCLEEEVAACAAEVLRTGTPALIDLDTRKRFGCDGHLLVFVERTVGELFAQIESDLGARRSCFLKTCFDMDDAQRGTHRIGATGAASEIDGWDVLIHELKPPIRFWIFGWGPETVPLKKISETLGWEFIPIEATHSFSPVLDDRTVALVTTHNYGRDFAVLSRLLPLNLPYVGLIGPRRRRDRLLNDLLDVGITINASFFAPAGADLGSDNPEEIALSVVSEIQRVLTHSSGTSLRERRHHPIHARAKSAVPAGP